MKKQKFNEERTYGIEIEFTTADREEVASLIRGKGLECSSERYNHRTSRTAWKVITDSSCGSELVSPILKGREGLRQLKIVTEALKEAGAKVNRNCGLHIHHDVNDYNAKQMVNIFAYYTRYEKALDSLMPNSRRANNNRYSKSLYNGNQPQELLDHLKEVKTISELQRTWNTRYLKVNFQSYVTYGTVEFRQHSGTIEYEKIYNWILLTQQIVEKSGGTAARKTYNMANDTIQHISDTFGLIRSEGASDEIADMFKWYRGRAAQLAA